MPSLFKQSKFTPQTSMAKSQWLVVIVILLLASALRFHALAQDARFHPDEALFATFARNAAVKGDWLLRGPLDKTPLTIYAQALSMTFFGVQQVNDVLDLEIHTGEFVARLPNTFASILLVAVMYALAKRFYPFGVYGEGGQTSKRVWEVGLISMTLTAFSPYAVAFSATAFTDGLMLLLITLALWMASAGRWAWSGFYLVLAYASKQQALLYAPLILTVGWAVGALYITPLRKLFHFIMPLALGFSVFLGRCPRPGNWRLGISPTEQRPRPFDSQQRDFAALLRLD
jgi:4-amino-4-deoxy-L-arabinose transferase-like glycosyltransferase